GAVGTRDEQIEDVVDLPGRVTKAEIIEWFRGAGVLELPHIFGDFGPALDEAMDNSRARLSGLAHLIADQVIEPHQRVEVSGQGVVIEVSGQWSVVSGQGLVIEVSGQWSVVSGQ